MDAWERSGQGAKSGWLSPIEIDEASDPGNSLGGEQFGDNHKVKLGRKRSKTNGVKLGGMASGWWVSPGALVAKVEDSA